VGSAQQRLNRLSDSDFRGPVGKKIANYAKEAQNLCRDFAGEFDQAARDSKRAMRKLQGHRLLNGVDVRIRSRRVSRRLRRASELARSASSEIVKFNQQYRREFLDIQDAGTKPANRHDKNWFGNNGKGVDL
jgi:hypothetical protein